MTTVQSSQETPISTKPTVTISTAELSPPHADQSSLFIETFRKAMERSTPRDIRNDILNALYPAYERSSISMIPMYALPRDRVVSGKFLCLELGGSTMRCGVVDFDDDAKLKGIKCSVLSEVEKRIDLEFFDRMVERCVESAVMWDGVVNVAVTWSFPVDDRGVIITMGKGWHLDDEVRGVSLNELIERAFEKQGLTVCVHKVVNDSLGTALAGLAHGGLSLSLILGTGVNVCLLKDGQLLNSELGFFSGLDRPTKYDLLVDERWLSFEKAWMVNSEERIYQPFEMLTSGRYMCELLRLILADLNAADASFPELQAQKYELHGSLFCLFASTSKSLYEIQQELQSTHGLIFELSHIERVCNIATIILQRSAKYVKEALAAMFEFTTGTTTSSATRIPVTYTGSFLQHCTEYQLEIMKDCGIELTFIADSSLIGAAVAAAL